MFLQLQLFLSLSFGNELFGEIDMLHESEEQSARCTQTAMFYGGDMKRVQLSGRRSTEERSGQMTDDQR